MSEEAEWACGVGGQLRLIQASFADDDAATRQQYLSEEIARALKTVPPTKRRGHLQALAERFPAWESAPTPKGAPAVELPPEELVARLVEAAPYLTITQRRALSEQLEAAGLVASKPVPAASASHAVVSEPVPEELQKKLGLEPNQSLSQVRVLRLIAVLTEFSVTLDQLSWNVWKQIAPHSIVRRDAGPEGDFRKIAGPYLAGDDEVSTAQISQVVDKTRQLIAGLLAAIGSTGETFARQFLGRIGPQAIKEKADAESGFFVGPEQKCWRKYVETFNEISGLSVEQEIAGVLVSQSEELILGKGRQAGGGNVTRGKQSRSFPCTLRFTAGAFSVKFRACVTVFWPPFHKCPCKSTGTKAFSSSLITSSNCKREPMTPWSPSGICNFLTPTASSRPICRPTNWKACGCVLIGCTS